MEDDMFKDGEVYTIQYQKIISDKKLLPSTRLLATEILDKGYMRVGDYLKELVDNDLNYFLVLLKILNVKNFQKWLYLAKCWLHPKVLIHHPHWMILLREQPQ